MQVVQVTKSKDLEGCVVGRGSENEKIKEESEEPRGNQALKWTINHKFIVWTEFLQRVKKMQK